MLVVSFYTPDYFGHAKRLTASCKRLGYRYWIEPVESSGSWVKNCSTKSAFILSALISTGKSVLWLDADAEIKRPLDYIEDLQKDTDFAIWHSKRGSPKLRFRSGTVFLNYTPAALDLAMEWTRRCEENEEMWDQECLFRAWHNRDFEIRTEFLPQTYCQVFDEDGVADPHIVHHQASREVKKKEKANARRR